MVVGQLVGCFVTTAFVKFYDAIFQRFVIAIIDPIIYCVSSGDWVAAWVVADGQWCRARVTAPGETSPDSVSVRYLDYGEDAELNPAQLRPLPASLSALTASLPALAIACALTPTIYPVGSGDWCPTTIAFVEEQFPAWGRVTVQVVDKTAEGTALVVVKREDGASLADLILSTERGSTEAPPDPSTLPLPHQIRFLANAVPPFPVERLSNNLGFSAIIPHMSDWQNIFVHPLTEENRHHMVLVLDEITKVRVMVCIDLCCMCDDLYRFREDNNNNNDNFALSLCDRHGKGVATLP